MTSTQTAARHENPHTYNCHVTDANGIKFMFPVMAVDLDDASIKAQLAAPTVKLNRLVRSTTDWATAS